MSTESGDMKMFYETLHRDFQQGLAMEDVLFEGSTEFQSAQIFSNKTFGKILILDGVVQTTEADEFIYHEMLAHVPLFALDKPRDVLIIGGGDGGCLEEVLKHPVESATMVELDPGVVDISREHLRSICGDAFEDPRTNLVIGDGAKFVADTDRRFDLIIIDSTDPVGPGEVLFSESFYANCRLCMTDRGILITQNGVPFLQRAELDKSLGIFRTLFRHAGFYLITVPTYAGGPMALGCASNGTDVAGIDVDLLRTRYQSAGFETRYYSPDVHKGAFGIPGFLKSDR